MNDFEIECLKYDAEVRRVAADLLREGYTPITAVIEAREVVRRLRHARAIADAVDRRVVREA